MTDPGAQFTAQQPTIHAQPNSALNALTFALARAGTQNLVQKSDETRQFPVSNTFRVEAANIKTTTSVERALGTSNDEETSTVTGETCTPDDVVDVRRWGDVDDPFRALSQARKTLFDENGNPSAAGTIRLAQAYIFMGFGAEAEAVLSDLDLPDVTILKQLASIVEGDLPTSNGLSGQAGCPGKISMWSLFEGGVEPQQLPEDTKPILVTFEELPWHLQKQLGMTLSERLRGHPDQDASRLILSILDRSQPAPVSRGEISAPPGNTGTANRAWRGEIETAEAIYANVASRLDEGVSIEWKEIEQIEALAMSVEGHAVASELTGLSLRARIASGDFLGTLERLKPDWPTSQFSKSDLLPERTQLWVTAAERADDETFLRVATQLNWEPIMVHLNTPSRQSVVARLLQVGLLDRARGQAPILAQNADKAVVISTLQLQAGRPDLALAALRGAEVHAHGNYTKALLETGQLVEAARSYKNMDERVAAQLTAMRAADWNLLREFGFDLDLDVESKNSIQDDKNSAKILNSRVNRESLSEALDKVLNFTG